ncbi:MAG: hypothetical protein D6707_12105 [Bacteroidetes bacterium]|nr:MAG: hypothetical protein D6707_12105 [Bacteroidota bacterium]
MSAKRREYQQIEKLKELFGGNNWHIVDNYSNKRTKYYLHSNSIEVKRIKEPDYQSRQRTLKY